MTELLDATEPQSTTIFEGRGEYLFWSPQSDKLYTLVSHQSSDTGQWITNLNYTTFVPDTQASVPFHLSSRSAVDSTLTAYNRGRDTNTRFYPNGFSSNGQELLYTREVTTNRGIIATGFAYNYRTAKTREIAL